MAGNGKRGKYLAAVMAVFAIAALAAGAVGVAKPVKSIVGEIETEFDGGFSPKALPKKKPAPITFFLWGKIRHIEGKHPPALKEFELEGDKHVEIDVKGLPTCTSGKLQSKPTAAARKSCPTAIVGTGTTEVEVQFPDQPKIDVKSELLAFNGGVKGGVTTLYIHAFLTAPVPAAIVTTVKVKKIKKGRYGTQSIATIPKIAGGSGSVTYFRLSFKKGILRATCPDGHLNARGTAVFADGTRASAGVVKPCTPKG